MQRVNLPDRSNSTHHLAGSNLLFARIAWIALVGITVLLFILSIQPHFDSLMAQAASELSAGSTGIITPQNIALYYLLLDVFMALAYAAIAVRIFWGKASNWYAMFVSAMLITFGIGVANSTIYALLRTQHFLLPLVFVVSIIGTVLFVIFIYTLPDGRFAPRWTAVVPVLWAVVSVAVYALPESVQFQRVFVIISLLVYGGSTLALDYKRKHLYTREHIQQVKWITVGLAIALIGFIIGFAPPALFPQVIDPARLVGPEAVLRLLYVVALSAVPFSIGFSVYRYRLWDVDFIINRGLVYAVLTFGLGGVFISGLLLVQLLMRQITGDQQTPLAMGVSALVIGGLFQPVRKQLQAVVDRRLYGINIDYKQVAAAQKPPTKPGVLTGRQLGVYDILEPLGRGGMAEVYKGYHPGLDRYVAIKILPTKFAGEANFRHRFEREAQTVARLNHDHIVNIFDFGEFDFTYYMAMEYLDGPDLSDYLRQQGHLPLTQTRQIVTLIGSALDYAHGQGLVHRDIKPSNIMLQPISDSEDMHFPFRPVLMDFGVAKILSSDTRLTQTGMVGTLYYIAPEQIRASRDVDRRADIYALGVMTYEMLTGNMPFQADNPGAVVLAHLTQPPPDVRNITPDIPDYVSHAVQTAMAKDPAERFDTATLFAEALEGSR